MKKTILVSALVLVLLTGVGTGAYMLNDNNENKPLILKCTVSESPADSSQVGVSYFWKFWAPEHNGTPDYWDFAEEDWVRYETFGISTVDKNRFTWRDERYGRQFETQIDRNSGDFLVSEYQDRGLLGCDWELCKVKLRGNCVKSAEPAKRLKQKF